MATAVHCISSCFSLLSLNPSSRNNFSSLGFSRNVSSGNVFSKGCLTISPAQVPRRLLVVCEAAPLKQKKKVDSAVKRQIQNEKRRIYHKSKKSEVKTRMKKVLVALDKLRKKKDAQFEEIVSIEKFIAEAYSAIDKAVTSGTFHRHTGRHRKSRLARRKKAIEIHHGWYTPALATDAAK